MEWKTLTIAVFLPCSILAQAGDDMMAGLTALKSARHSQAEQAFTRVVAATPDRSKAWYYRAVNRMDMGDLDGAKSDLEQLLRLSPNDMHGLLRHAEVLAAQGHPDAAKADLTTVVDLSERGPLAAHALLQLGHLAMLEGALGTARVHYERLIQIAPENAYGHCDLGIVLAAMQEDDLALFHLDQAVSFDPTLDQAYTHRAILLIRMDRRKEACQDLQQARALGDVSVEEMQVIYCDR
ncbi:MAG: tetratricopeptide repeat protein [Flavobacteriales bacterium]|nr:tetratricopeptide repeat protein [Flavobacteriales bacterium]